MAAYHTIWDLVYIFDIKMPWFAAQAVHIWELLICTVFIFVSGFCAGMSRKNFKRGLTVFLCGLLVSAVTAVVTPNQCVRFGVLTLLGSCMLIFSAVQKPLKRANPFVGFGAGFLLFAFAYGVNKGYLGFFTLRLIELPQALYKNTLSAYFGFPPPAFTSSDYFSLIPWLFLFLTGFFFFEILMQKHCLGRLKPSKCRPLEWLGKHSLVIYLAHQPIIYVVLSAVFFLIKR